MNKWFPKMQAWRFLGPALAFFLIMIFTHAVFDYYDSGRIRFDFFPRRIVVYLLVGNLIGFSRWRKESSKRETPPA